MNDTNKLSFNIQRVSFDKDGTAIFLDIPSHQSIHAVKSSSKDLPENDKDSFMDARFVEACLKRMVVKGFVCINDIVSVIRPILGKVFNKYLVPLIFAAISCLKERLTRKNLERIYLDLETKFSKSEAKYNGVRGILIAFLFVGMVVYQIYGSTILFSNINSTITQGTARNSKFTMGKSSDEHSEPFDASKFGKFHFEDDESEPIPTPPSSLRHFDATLKTTTHSDKQNKIRFFAEQHVLLINNKNDHSNLDSVVNVMEGDFMLLEGRKEKTISFVLFPESISTTLKCSDALKYVRYSGSTNHDTFFLCNVISSEIDLLPAMNFEDQAQEGDLGSNFPNSQCGENIKNSLMYFIPEEKISSIHSQKCYFLFEQQEDVGAIGSTKSCLKSNVQKPICDNYFQSFAQVKQGLPTKTNLFSKFWMKEAPVNNVIQFQGKSLRFRLLVSLLRTSSNELIIGISLFEKSFYVFAEEPDNILHKEILSLTDQPFKIQKLTQKAVDHLNEQFKQGDLDQYLLDKAHKPIAATIMNIEEMTRSRVRLNIASMLEAHFAVSTVYEPKLIHLKSDLIASSILSTSSETEHFESLLSVYESQFQNVQLTPNMRVIKIADYFSPESKRASLCIESGKTETKIPNYEPQAKFDFGNKYPFPMESNENPQKFSYHFNSVNNGARAVGFSASTVIWCGNDQFVVEQDTDYMGYDCENSQAFSVQQCCVLCVMNSNCQAFSYILRENQCWMKYSHKQQTNANAGRAFGVASGYKLRPY